jgi:hypothetical protein
MKILTRTFALAALLLIGTSACSTRPVGHDQGMPYGRVEPADVERLEAYARRAGLNLTEEMTRAYRGDADALARVFALSLEFSHLDQNAKTYGQLIYSSFLNLGERRAGDFFVATVVNQPERVQQRIRDFLFYVVTQAPRKQQAEAEANMRKEFPTLFPSNYVFGAEGSLFR